MNDEIIDLEPNTVINKKWIVQNKCGRVFSPVLRHSCLSFQNSIGNVQCDISRCGSQWDRTVRHESGKQMYVFLIVTPTPPSKQTDSSAEVGKRNTSRDAGQWMCCRVDRFQACCPLPDSISIAQQTNFTTWLWSFSARTCHSTRNRFPITSLT